MLSPTEFKRIDLRVHEFLADIPLHDVWAVDLPRERAGITLDAFLRATEDRPSELPAPVRALFAIRWTVGRAFGWDRERAPAPTDFTSRLTDGDRARTLVEPGTREGVFRIVYRFENEQLVEVRNATVHGAALSALVERESDYRYVFAVYVRNVSRLTPIYMRAIDPFRKLFVYPALLRGIRSDWDAAMSP